MPTQTDNQALTKARAQFRLYAQPDIQPVIDGAQIDLILEECKTASTWAVNTAYVLGDVILPTIRNGHQYICTVAGTSETDSADEPDWPTVTGGLVTEGASDPILTWVEYGPEPVSIYDVRKAIHNAWMVKAGLASLSVDVSQQVGGLKASQVYEHCIKQAERFASLDIG